MYCLFMSYVQGCCCLWWHPLWWSGYESLCHTERHTECFLIVIMIRWSVKRILIGGKVDCGPRHRRRNWGRLVWCHPLKCRKPELCAKLWSVPNVSKVIIHEQSKRVFRFGIVTACWRFWNSTNNIFLKKSVFLTNFYYSIGFVKIYNNF